MGKPSSPRQTILEDTNLSHEEFAYWLTRYMFALAADRRVATRSTKPDLDAYDQTPTPPRTLADWLFL